MRAPGVPENERERLQALAAYHVLDTPLEASFDALTTLAASILDVPIALVSLVDVDRQWFKSRYGLDAPETPREVSFCGHVVSGDAPLIVPDAFADERFADNPLVTGGPFVRFYAGMPLRTPEGFVLGTLCVIDHMPREVTAKQRELLALLAGQVVELLELRRRSHLLRQFQTMLDGTKDAIFIFEPETLRFLYANQGAINHIGYSLRELLRMTPLDIEMEFNDAEYRKMLQPLVNGEKSVVLFEAPHRNKQGQPVPVEVVLQYMAPPGEAPRFIKIARDISERRRLDQLKADFISTVSHELRTPLTSIRGSLGLLAAGLNGSLPPQAKEYVDIALANTIRLVRITNDILDIDRIQCGRMEFRLLPLPLDGVIRKAIEANRPFAAALEVELVLSAGVDDVEVICDEGRALQVLANLISNAAKFSPRGGQVDLWTTLEAGCVRVNVRDRGPGVPKEFRERVFERFARADSAPHSDVHGSGLGLSIAKAMAEGMHGEIGFEAAEGGGTNFFFVLPCRPLGEAT